MAENKSKLKKHFKRLIIFIIIAALIAAADYGIFKYASGVFVQNLESIASLEQQEKAKVSLPENQLQFLITEAAELSCAAYENENESACRQRLGGLGYGSISVIENNPSMLYSYLKAHNKGSEGVLFSTVSAVTGCKQINFNGGEKTLVAVAFRGTVSSDIVDDLSDIYNKTDRGGFHKGFMYNAENFYSKAGKLHFDTPEGKLTLSDIFEKLQSPQSDYMLLVTGHSLGAAVADVLTGKLLYDAGVSTSNAVAVTFGTPKTSSSDYTYTAGNVINIINKDDMVGTIGAENHLGSNVLYTPTENFRRENYGDKYIDQSDLEVYDNNYSNIFDTVRSGLVAHNMQGTYLPIARDISENTEEYFDFAK